MFLDRGAWQAIVHRVAKSQTQLCDLECTHQSLLILGPIWVISPYHLQPKGNLCCLHSQTRQLGLSNRVKFTQLLSCRAKLLTQICVNLPEINYTFHQLQGNSLHKPLRKNGKCCQLHLSTMLSYHLSFDCRILEKKISYLRVFLIYQHSNNMEGLEEVKGRFWATIRTPFPSSHGPWVPGGWGLRLLEWGRMCHTVYGPGQLSENLLIFQPSHLILKFSMKTNFICILL